MTAQEFVALRSGPILVLIAMGLFALNLFNLSLTLSIEDKSEQRHNEGMAFATTGITAVSALANEAMIAARTARPNPYTSINAAHDKNDLISRFESELGNFKSYIDSAIAVVEVSLDKKIETLPRPPNKTQKQIDLNRERIQLLELSHASRVYEERQNLRPSSAPPSN